MMDEKKEQLEKVRRAFRDPYLRGWIPNNLLTILEQGENTEDILSQMEQVMPKYCVPRKFETEERQSLDEGSEKQNDWRSLLFELSPTVRIFWAEKYNHYINPNGKYQALLGFTDMRERPTGQALARNLLWGYYRNGELQTAFALKEDGSVMDRKGETVSLETFVEEQGRIGLAHPEELMESERNFWKKYTRKEKWKQPFPQVKISVCQGRYDLSVFRGIQVTQLFLITAAGKWGLYQGSSKNQYMSYHMADLLHGYGAQLTFDGIWRGSEYFPETITMDKVIFYRFQHFQLWDHVPESLICTPEELPARFVSTALAAFRGIIGNGKKE